MADCDELFGFVGVEAPGAAHLDVDEEVGLRELGHEERVLTDHDGAGAGEQRVVVEVDVVGVIMSSSFALSDLSCFWISACR